MLNQSLSILHEDSDCLAIAKPAGQFTQGTWAPPGETTLETAVRRHLNPTDPGSVYLGIVHRLDRPTSGVLLWAKTTKAARRLSSQFEKRQVVKEYWAIVAPTISRPGNPGEFPPDLARQDEEREETWCDWLTHPSETGLAHVVAPETKGSRQAVTLVRRHAMTTDLAAAGSLWLRMWPKTGRTHQLRAQAAARGMPILGDVEYGAASAFGRPHTIGLHARSLEVRHPILQTPLFLVAPLPPEWRSFGVTVTGGG
jgi:23S rRNA pseudouridine1911/1915/1917 synthase